MRILIVRLSHLGDVVHALGVHHALHAAYPDAEIAWAIQPEFAELVRPLPGIARVIPFGRREGWRAWPRLSRELGRFRADWTIDCQGNLKSAGVVLASRAGRRSGLARADWREPLGAKVLNDPAPAVPGGAKHAMDRMATLVRHLVPERAGPLRLDPALSAAERAAGRREWEARGPAERALALVHLSSAKDIRGWPLERWQALASALERHGHGALFLAGPAEAEVGRALEASHPAGPRRAYWTDQRGLRALAGLAAAAAERGSAFLGCDSGPAHLAAACGASVALLTGPQDPERTGPWPPGPSGPHLAVRARLRPGCQPCLERRCAHPRGPVCMSAIDPRDVVVALEELAARTRPAAARATASV